MVTYTITARDSTSQDYSVIVTEDKPKSLRELATDKGIYVGAAVDPDYLDESEYAVTLAREFDCVVAENVMKWIVIEPLQNTFDYTEADQMINSQVIKEAT
ncbi:MAG: endo-1,4-beta-xylanase [Spirochaetota bacterium]|nr:endo-1,4-beta-xylanase [Spirochaetota bacterium]